MQILKQRFFIYPEHPQNENSILGHIEYCGRICANSRDKIRLGSAKPFVGRCIKKGHWSVLEMANLMFSCWGCPPIKDSPYIKITSPQQDQYIYSGSPRAFYEGWSCLPDLVAAGLQAHYPFFFGSLNKRIRPDKQMICPLISYELPYEHRLTHRKIAVEFWTDRAVTHEIVRHRPLSVLQESQRYCRYEGEVAFIRQEGIEMPPLRSYLEQSEQAYHRLLAQGFRPEQARVILPNATATKIIVYADLNEWKHIFDLRCSPAAYPQMRALMKPLRKAMNKYYKEKEKLC